MNKKTLFFLINIPVWLLMLSLVYTIGFHRYINQPEMVISSKLSFILFYSFLILSWLLSSFNVFYAYLVPKYWLKRKWKAFSLMSFLFIIIVAPIFLIIAYNIPAEFIFGLGTLSSTNDLQLVNTWIFISVSTLIIGTIGVICRLIYFSLTNKESKKELENKNLQIELNTLKAKLNPHLLFNSINNIDTLIHTNPEKASLFLSKLSDLLRYVIYDVEEEKISIFKEISNLKKYIELETIRLTNPECVSFEMELTKDILIPPMLFFPFVENSFKHSNLNKNGQYLKISVREDDRSLVFECLNTVMEKPKKEEIGGVGLSITKKRLDLLFPDKHELIIEQDFSEFSVLLRIDLE
ncbi:MAG: histidine kinase [Bacteroidales bacterium]|nr:histidine kinase [Bacteroidales bacterium]MDP2237169.1 histidine kinase [Bacteroidales bacterium]